MISLDDAVIARLESHGCKFEILVDPDKAALIRLGTDIDIEDCVAALHVFENASQAERSSDEDLLKAFSTTNFHEIAAKIIRKGDIHLTAEQRRQMIAEKRKQIIAFIARHAENPQTGLPHPPQRIENALDEARVSVDPFKSVDEQVKEAMKALRPLLPIRFAELRLAVKIPGDYAARAYGDIAAVATIEKDEWQKNGSWICVVTIPAGIQNEFYGLLNKICKGDAEVKILKNN
ncbi:MAG: ribosome assembly factor SBDS [Methanomicrobiales archaeon]|jgi:ribosome maturation protein SDO1|nr:ribosome assembly factor SBDS [Methanomicrobiales archaeon]